jgi:hypothetical protein
LQKQSIQLENKDKNELMTNDRIIELEFQLQDKQKEVERFKFENQEVKRCMNELMTKIEE